MTEQKFSTWMFLLFHITLINYTHLKNLFIFHLRSLELQEQGSKKEKNTGTSIIMFPLYRLGFTPLWNSYRIGLLFPFKTNNSARFLYRIAFTTQRFWKWYKIYRIVFTTAQKYPEVPYRGKKNRGKKNRGKVTNFRR